MRKAVILAIVCLAAACAAGREDDPFSPDESSRATAPLGEAPTVPPPASGPPAGAAGAEPARPGGSGTRDLPSRPPAKLIKLTEPNRNGVCRFEERDPSLRPKGLVQTTFHSNMIFWADRGAALWDHPYGTTDEGMVIPGKRIVVAREGKSDLWISPGQEGDIMLFSGPDRFECVPRQSD